MANYSDDWTIFFTRLKSAVLMALAAGFALWVMLPEFHRMATAAASDRARRKD